jgi:hypothetical protein
MPETTCWARERQFCKGLVGIVVPRQPLPRQGHMSTNTALNNKATFSARLAEAERKRKADLAAADQAAAAQRAAAAAEQQRLAEERKVLCCSAWLGTMHQIKGLLTAGACVRD